jgi:hypothetical protein
MPMGWECEGCAPARTFARLDPLGTISRDADRDAEP